MVVVTIEVDRPPGAVFAYFDTVGLRTDWQDGLRSSRLLTDGTPRVGTRFVETRVVPGGPRDFTLEITEHDPPRHAAWRGLDGPIRPVGSVDVEALDDGLRSRITTRLDIKGHGFGKLIAPFARRSAAHSLPQDYARLKARLENT